jgi:hypothetical protein
VTVTEQFAGQTGEVDFAGEAPAYNQAVRTIAVDFDGVIHRYSRGWQGGAIYDGAVPGAIEGLMRLLLAGYRVVIFTTRCNEADFPDNGGQREAIYEWLMAESHKVFDPPNGSWPCDPVFRKTWSASRFAAAIEVTALKPSAIAYIDDRGIRFTDWTDILKYFL